MNETIKIPTEEEAWDAYEKDKEDWIKFNERSYKRMRERWRKNKG